MTNLHLTSSLRLIRPVGPKVWPHHTTHLQRHTMFFLALELLASVLSHLSSLGWLRGHFWPSVWLETLQTSLFHTYFVALNEQHTCTEASSEAIVGPSLFNASQKTSGLVLCCPVFRPIVGGQKEAGIWPSQSHSPSCCLLAAWHGDKEEAEEAEEAPCSVLEEGWGKPKRAQTPTWESQLDTRALRGVRSWRSGGATTLLPKLLGKGQDGDERLHAPSSSASLPLWWHWEEAIPSFKDAKFFFYCHLSLLLPNKYETMLLNDVSGLTLHN